MTRVFLALVTVGLAFGCGSGESDAVPNYGRGKVYETRQATNVLATGMWCDTVMGIDGRQDTYTFHRNGTGRFAVWNAKSEKFVEDERMWWQLKADVLSVRITDKFGPEKIETLRFRSNDGQTVVVFLERTGQAEVILTQCALPKEKTRNN